MDLPAIVQRFEVEHVPIGGPVFDFAKLDWLNGRYIRERLDPAIVRGARARVGDFARALDAHRRARGAAHRAVERSGPAAGLSFLRTAGIDARSLCESAKLDAPRCAARLRMRLTEFDALAGVERFGDRGCDQRGLRHALGQEAARRRASVLRRDHRQPDVDSALRFDGVAWARPRSRTVAQRARGARHAQQTRAEEWEPLQSPEAAV